ncbi:hypothetical protein F4859DRAFT_516794 [Xylaria cf. heliscus]|nr:hypothetical protein F4859DRAFT_516794 [Xylaria cf. heliscus]
MADHPEEIHQPQPPAPPPLPTSLPRPPRASPSTSNPTSKRAKMASQFGLADGPREPHPPLFTPTTFKPCHIFFYGTLMDADVLQHITRCPNKPVLRPGWITGFKLKMWGGTFPTLLPPATETSAYRGHRCQIHVEDMVDGSSTNEGDRVLEGGVVFVWAKNPHSPDLSDGTFDLAKWQKTHKPSLFKPAQF